jgi:hypothetical protein
MGMGLLFTEVDREHVPVLEKWLAELSGEATPESEAAEAVTQGNPPESAHLEVHNVLNELITALMRKRVLNDAEGKALLQKLTR